MTQGRFISSPRRSRENSEGAVEVSGSVHWGQPLGSGSSRKNVAARFSLNRFLSQPKKFLFAGQSKPAFSLVLNRVFVDAWSIVATRSVSHLVLAHAGAITSSPPNSNRKEQAGTGVIAGSVSAPPGSVFLRQATY